VSGWIEILSIHFLGIKYIKSISKNYFTKTYTEPDTPEGISELSTDRETKTGKPEEVKL
jgi:hypothetical protein